MTDRFSVSIKVGNCEVQLNGAKSDVMETLEKLPDILKSLSEAMSGSSTLKEPEILDTVGKAREVRSTVKEYPTINVSSNAKCPEVIMKLLGTEWGRSAPRTSKDIMEAMKVNAMYYPEGTVLGRLTDLTKKGVLRRIKTEKGYAYILLTGR